MALATPDLAAKWGVDASELALAFDFLGTHHLKFVATIAQAALTISDPSQVKAVVAGSLEQAAAPAIGVSPTTIALIFQVIQAVYPFIAKLLEVFLGSIVPTPAPKPAA